MINLYYSIKDVVNSEIETDKRPFIIANDYKKKDGDIGRTYSIFKSFNHFIEKRKDYPHCHEIMLDHYSVKPFTHGRLVFDLDITTKYNNQDYVPHKFMSDFEKLIKFVIKKHFIDVNISIIEFIWTISNSPDKYSKHLTVKNFCFDDWLKMSALFYKFMEMYWDFDFALFDDVVDKQVVRKHGSLRMQGSSKMNKNYVLEFEDDCYDFEDTLIRIYDKEQRKKEQIITYENVINEPIILFESLKKTVYDNNRTNLYKFVKTKYKFEVYENIMEILEKKYPKKYSKINTTGNVIHLKREKKDKEHNKDEAFIIFNDCETFYELYLGCFICHKYITRNNSLQIFGKLIKTNNDFHQKKEYKNIDLDLDDAIYNQAFEIIEEKFPNTFIVDKKNNSFIHLKRISPCECPFSGRIHEGENCYLCIKDNDEDYDVYYGCFRKCSSKSSMYIKSIPKQKDN